MSDRLVSSPHSSLLTLQSTQPPIHLAPVAVSLDKMLPRFAAVLNSYHCLMSKLKALKPYQATRYIFETCCLIKLLYLVDGCYCKGGTYIRENSILKKTVQKS